MEDLQGWPSKIASPLGIRPGGGESDTSDSRQSSHVRGRHPGRRLSSITSWRGAKDALLSPSEMQVADHHARAKGRTACSTPLLSSLSTETDEAEKFTMKARMILKENWTLPKTELEEWHTLLHEYRHLPTMTLRRFGATLLYLLATSPTMISRSSRRQLAAKLDGNSTQSTDSKGDVLPLPLPSLATVEQQVRQFLEGDASSCDLKNIDEEATAHYLETYVKWEINHWY